jgi:hypothetical protein
MATSAGTASAQVPDAAALPRPAVEAARIEGAPTLDGEVLSDEAWANVPIASGFSQTAPDEGQPATERTEVRMAFTADTLYVGVVCYDRDPQGIIVSDSRRDSSLSDSDSFQFILDTFSDRQNGFVFGTSPAGQEYDGQVVNEGAGGSGGAGGASSGAGGGFNINWDGAWQVRTQMSDVGWSAEFAIPFRTIRYPSTETQTWGVNFQRTIRRRSENAFWAPLPRQYGLFRVSLAGRVSGVTVPQAAVSNLTITPYVLGEALRLDGNAAGRTRRDGNIGGDLKYSITSGLTLDATYNTDFAQIEVDQQQINLDRFNLFFPEKRPFFLENAGIFAVSNAGGAVRGDPAQTELFFSRAIGFASGRAVPIVAGARVSGRIGGGYTLGVLNMQTEELDGVTPANNFTVARLRRDLPNRSTIGGLFVNRQATGDLAGDDDYNRTFGLDGRFGIGEDGRLDVVFGKTQTPGRTGRDHVFAVAGDHSSERWRALGGYMESGEDFNPEVGFVRRVGFRKMDLGVYHTWRPEALWKFQEIIPHMTFNRFWDFSGFTETSLLHSHSFFDLEDSSRISVAFDVREEGVKVPFRVSGLTVPAGSYDWSQAEFSYNTNRSKALSVGFRVLTGGYFGGDILELGPSIAARYGETLSASVSWSRNDIDLPSGSVMTNLVSTRVAYNFSPSVFVQSLLEYNDSADVFAVNLRFGWLQAANTGLFFVYNETEGLESFVPSGAGRRVILKYSYMFNVLQ